MRALLCALPLSLFTACATNPETGEREVNFAVVRQELTLIQADIEGAGQAVSDPDLQEKLARVSAATGAVNEALGLWMANREDPGAQAGLLEATQAALAVADELAASLGEDADELRLLIFAAGAVLRRIAVYAE